jgi:hypothetical protein
MNYNIKRKDNEGIQLKSGLSTRILTVLFLLVPGIVFLPVGLLLLAFSDSRTMGLGFIGTGVFLLSGYILAGAQERFMPVRLTFDNSRESFIARDRNGDEAGIGYGQLAGFRGSWNRGNGYVIYMEMKNGGVWDLTRTGRSFTHQPEEQVREMETSVPFQNSGNICKVDLPDWMKRSERNGCIYYSWKSRSVLSGVSAGMACLLGFALMMCCVLFGNAFYPVGSRIFLGITALLLVINAAYIFNQTVNESFLVIGPAKVEYGFGRNPDEVENGRWKVKKTVSRTGGVHAIYSYDTINNFYQSILFPDREAAEVIESVRSRSGGFNDIGKTLKVMSGLFRIEFPFRYVTDLMKLAGCMERDLDAH